MRTLTSVAFVACLLLSTSAAQARTLRVATLPAPARTTIADTFSADLQSALDGMRWAAGQALHELLWMQKSVRVTPELASMLLAALRSVPDMRVVAQAGVHARLIDELRKKADDMRYVGEMLESIDMPARYSRPVRFWIGVYLAHHDYFQKRLLEHAGYPATVDIGLRALHPDANATSCGPERHSCGEAATSSDQ